MYIRCCHALLLGAARLRGGWGRAVCHWALLMAVLLPMLLPHASLAQGDSPVPTVTPPAVVVTTTPTPVEGSALVAQVDAIMANMSVADKVGQLFIIGFEGGSVGFDSDAAELIYAYRVGGVVLSTRNNNFVNERNVDTPAQVATLVNRLQALAYGLLLPGDQALQAVSAEAWPPPGSVSMEQVTTVPPVNLPLLVAVEQSGDGLPMTMLRRGFSPLPSQMALGATWDTDLTYRVGQVVGRELAAVGVNLLLGPNLNVLELPRTDAVGTLGLQSFGGDANWVSQLGRVYIAGVHAGSDMRVATVARYFPGAGDADRLPDQEVATVQRSLSELERVTLPPFLAVTRKANSVPVPLDDPAVTDAMMSSHLRYSGLQGASLGRNTPISLAPEFAALLARPGLAEWHADGGVVMSNMLGAPALRRYYDPTLQEFPYRRVAMDAFLAGHDLLYLDRFSLDDQWETEKSNIKETIAFFQERYVADADFAAQVNAAVRRILIMKLGLYGWNADAAPVEAVPSGAGADAMVTVVPGASAGDDATSGDGAVVTGTAEVGTVVDGAAVDEASTDADAADVEAVDAQTADDVTVDESVAVSVAGPPVIPLADVLVDQSDLETLRGDAQAEALIIMGQVARESFTVLYPDPGAVAQSSMAAPQADEKILVITDSRLLRECGTCTAEAAVGPEEIEQIILRLYGPDGTGQLAEDQVVSLTFSDLAQALEAQAANQPVENNSLVLLPTPTATVPPTPDPSGGAVAGDGGESNTRTTQLIADADWVIFAMLDVDPTLYPSSDVVKRFLNQTGMPLADKRIVVLALHAPYFLDATEISKLAAYYAVYGKTQPFLESAVRALFRAYTPTGAPPVSVPGTRFASLAEQLAPDPQQPIELRVFDADGNLLAGEAVRANTELESVDAGELVRISTGHIFDHNRQWVRDGTPVEVVIAYENDSAAPEVLTAMTQSGRATRDVVLTRGGIAQISARAGEAVSTQTIALRVDGGTPVAAVPVATDTVTATDAVSATLASSTTVVGAAEAVPEDEESMSLVSLVVALLTMAATISLLLVVQVRVLPRQTLVHSMLWAVNCGLGAYILYGLGLMPGGSWLHGSLRVWGTGLVVFIGMLLPLVVLQLRTTE